MAYVSVATVRLYYKVDGEGPTVLLLHPVGLDSTCWTAQVEALVPVYRVLRVDLRGHGRSDVPPPPYTLGELATEVQELLRAAGGAPAHVIGLSLGGMVAQLLALEHPEAVRSLVLADTTCSLPPEARRAMVERGESARRGGMPSVLESTLARWFTSGFLGSEVVARCRARLLTDDVQGWAGAWQAIAGLDTEPRLAEIGAPTLVITGEADVSTPVSVARRMAGRIPGAVLHVVPGAPHMAPLERPDLFNPPVLDFLRHVR